MEMYSEKINANQFNISIDGLQLIGEEISPNESFNRRETSRKHIIGGTQSVIRTNYIHRDFSFTCHLRIDPLYPDIYDSTFQLWQSKPVEVISKELGGKFNAECVIKKKHETPAYLTIEVQLIEIPETSLIPNDSVKVPTDKITKTSTKNKNKGSTNKNTKKDTKKTTKKTTKKGNSKKGSKKGNKITKVKK